MDVPERVTVSVTKELFGAAYINYGLSRTDVLPDYRQNRDELAKILSTIDSVKNVNGVTVKKIYLCGYASPESPFDNNERLARERTLALRDYIMNQYSFEEGIIETSYEPENRSGLRDYVRARSYLKEARALGIIEASAMLRQCDALEEFYDGK